MDLTAYWNNVRAIQAKLPHQQMYYLVSIDNADKGTIAGRVMDLTDPKLVARRIVERTHILATEREISAHKAAMEKQGEDLAELELNRKGHLAMPKELQSLVHLAADAALRDRELRTSPPDSKKDKEK